MNLPSSSPHDRPQQQQNGTAGSGSSDQYTGTPQPQHRLTPQEAALRGASLAFQKQQHQAQEGGHTHKTGVGNGGSINISRQTTGASGGGGGGRISRQPTGSSVRSQRDYADEAAEKERDRERKALFLSSSATPEQQQHLLLPPGARPSGAAPTDSRSASFIAATLAASRSASVSPGTVLGAENGAATVPRRSPLREPVDLRRGSAASTGGLDEVADTTSLAPATSLISLFENHRGTNDLVRRSSDRPAKRKSKPRSPKPPMRAGRTECDEHGRPSVDSVETSPKPHLKTRKSRLGVADNDDSGVVRVDPSPQPRMDMKTVKTSPSRPFVRKPKPVSPKPEVGLEDENMETGGKSIETKPKSKPSPKPKPLVIRRAETPSPPPPVFRRADTEIVSPKPRRPKTKPRLEVLISSSDSNENADITVEKGAKAKSKVLPKAAEVSRISVPQANRGEDQATRRPSTTSKNPVISVKSRPPAPRKSSGLSERLPPELRRQTIRRPSVISSHDGQEESKRWSGQTIPNPRPTTSDSKSSNDSFVSASSVPTRDDADSLLAVEALSSRSVTPKGRINRPASAQPLTALPIRQTATGSSQLTLDSLSNAIMAGSLASARHTPISLSDGRTPPPLPPSRRNGSTSNKHNPSSRRPSPHRMKHTLRQPKALSDDEETRRPHHKKGLNHKRHAHHEGSRSRWREEITEREKKRYEALWASNRGTLLLVAATQWQQQEQEQEQPPLRNESYEELSEHVANIVVRDLWRRSRLPEPELAEVWDLVYGHGRAPGRVLHGALNKQEFVVGMWLIDQRLRGRKIPPRVSESVWSSAKGLRVLSPDSHGSHGHGHGHKGKGKAR